METYRWNARVAGLLYILGTVFGITGGVVGGDLFLSLINGKPLEDIAALLASAQPSRLTAGAFFTLLMGVSLSMMTIFLYPVCRKDSEVLATGIVLFRGALEGMSYIISVLLILAFVALGSTGVPGIETTSVRFLGAVLYKIQDSMAPIGVIVFLIGASCLYLSLYRTRLIPRWLSVWGFVGVGSSLLYALSHYFHLDTGFGFYLQMILAPQEMVMGGWLVTVGFTKEAVARLGEPR